MKRFFFLTIFVFGGMLLAQSSSLYLPLNVKASYDSGIRNYDGTPGKNYWQNKSVYNISAELFPDSSILKGRETVKYFNNSPDTLGLIVVRLYQNIFKPEATRDWLFNKLGFTDGDVLEFIEVNGDTLDLSVESKDVSFGSTNLFIHLTKPLMPKDSAVIKFKWHFKIPSVIQLRMGDYGEGDMFVSYWYPQISVYDDVDGWDVLDYSGSVEFYNDFSDFDFRIAVPDNFTIWATGDLMNPDSVYSKEILAKLEKAKQSDETIHIITKEEREAKSVTVHRPKNVWHFSAKNVTDVSFAVSDNYLWDGASVIVDSSTGRRALTSVVYEDGAPNYDEGAQFARATIGYLANDLPGFHYPYSHHTTFCNKKSGGGMETPMMADDGAPSLRPPTIGLIAHEITHTYFPFIMGTNERKYAWMDEGWATFFPTEIIAGFEPDYDYWSGIVSRYENAAGKEAELPPIVLSYMNRGKYRRIAFYNRPACAYMELKNLLGRELFKKALLACMQRWHGKHPLPYDFFFTINDVAKKNLDWFWKPWFFEYGYPDLAIESVTVNKDEVKVKIAKLGNVPTRVKVSLVFADGEVQTKELKADVWAKGDKAVTIKFVTNKKVAKVLLGDKHIPDSFRDNNIYEIR